MKAGRFSSGDCPFDDLEFDDYVPIFGFVGSCHVCESGSGKFPDSFLARFIRTDGIYHVFEPIEFVYCGGCHSRLAQVALLCGNAVVDVTSEFKKEI